MIESSSGQHAVAIDVPISYMEAFYNEIFISPNGIIGFGERLPDEITQLQRLNKSAIAVYYAPIEEGKIYFRATSSDRQLLTRLTEYIHKAFPDNSDFSTLQATVVTWKEVQNKEMDGGATFQFLTLPWASSGGVYAQSGFSVSDGRYRNNINSGRPDVKDLVGLSNSPDGLFVFRISGSTIEDPRESTDDYDYMNYDQTDYDGDERKPPSDCPVDPYRDRCPEGCNVLIDERLCSRCVCADPHPEDGIEDNQLPEYSVHEKLPQRPVRPSEDHKIQESTIAPVTSPVEHEEPSSEPKHEPDRHHENKPHVTNCASAGEEACNQNAVCRDYTSGFCCECRNEYYGNGKECLKKGDPQRISGSFEGVINEISIDRTDLHTFITPTDGNVYSTISKIPSNLGYPFLLLNPIGSIMGWLFAEVQSPSVYNGFQLTGGLFNRTVTLHIGDRNHLSIRQQFSGPDIYHHFKSVVFVSGTLPDIAPDTEVAFPNYEEEYRRERPGLIRSYTGIDILLKESGQQKTIRMTVDQQIQYDECLHREFDKDSTVILRVDSVRVTYDPHEGLVRYVSRNYANAVGSGGGASQQAENAQVDAHQHGESQRQPESPTNRGEDVCIEGRHVCTLPNMRCRPVESSYRCECLPGYQATRDALSSLGWSCQDLNECERGDHTCDQNAVCSNTDGSFTCQCKPGYVGDGHRCTREHVSESEVRTDLTAQETEPQHRSGSCTNHQQCHRWGECAFTPGTPYGQCRCRGWYTGDGVNHCGPPEEQRRDEKRLSDNVPQRQVTTCGQHVCDMNAECMPSSSGGTECVCKLGYVGNGVTCESLTVEDVVNPESVPDENIGKVCRAHEECSEHGGCVYSDTLGYYHCVCRDPYEGNGIECTLKSREDKGEQGCDQLRNCDQNAQCVYDSHNSGSPSWEGEKVHHQRCRDSTDCHQYGHCVVGGDSGYVCECLPGYRGDGIQQCVVADQCNPADPSACAQNAECIYGDTERAYVCKCVRGFIGDGVRCVPHARPQTCREEPRLCHANAQCVYNNEISNYVCICKPGSVGDGTHRCDLQETPRCSNCSSNAHCSYSQQTGQWQCKCNPGYHGNGLLCVAMSQSSFWILASCLDDRSLCDSNAECVPGEGGHYVCNCHYGYHGNGRTCTPDSQSSEDILFISRGMAIFQRGLKPDVPGKQVIVVPHHIAVGLDFDCMEKRLVWSDISGHSIRSASLNGSDQLSFYTDNLSSPEGIAVDWSSRNVYYADSLNDEIGVASLDGKYQKALITEGLVNPRALALDIQNRHLYYTDWHRENPIIGRMDMDGQNNRVFLNEDVHLPNGITILPNRRELCWVDAGNHSNRIHSVGLYGDGYTSFPISLGGSGKVYGILAMPKQCNGPQTPCSVENGGCSYLCLPSHGSVRCECPSNVAVQGC
ncbi:G2F domain protein [Dictyocaulus viviparus]|uniref:G2F domain protein n=1 Tax=Dictyocaulus viviparus TaxID=29172 RepID=A0A0D8Y6J0_DICVI|nr:G2F domain protein [Dictyocaulus viviparus]